MFKTQKETGQSIVLIAVMIFGLLALSALIVDGGHMYLNHRQAQTAADAAALAAATEYCINKGTFADTDLVAQEYALNKNQATQMIDLNPAGSPDGIAPYILVDPATKNIKVAVGLTHSTFFAKIFGRPTTTVEADASAGCFPPAAADSVIPVAWTCRPPLPGVTSDSYDCDYKSIPWRIMKDILQDLEDDGLCPNSNDPKVGQRQCLTGNAPVIYHDNADTTPSNQLTVGDYSFIQGTGYEHLQLYIVMDGLPLADDTYCDTGSGGLEGYCDIDGDGRIDWTVSQRSWLLLDKDSNAGQLPNIVDGSLTFGMVVPGWYPGKNGNTVNVYGVAESFIEGTPALIPVFKQGYICQAVDPRVTCTDLADDDDYVMKLAGGDPETYYYVVGFAEFYVSCVVDKPNKICPGKELLMAKLKAANLTDLAKAYQNEPSIEGYFMDGWVADNPDLQTGENQIDLGIYIITLTE